MGRYIDLTGKSFGKLTVIAQVSSSQKGQLQWLCECTCGKQAIVRGCHLRSGHTTSCGCNAKESIMRIGKKNVIHGSEKTRLYHIWRGMKQRCFDEKVKDYRNYGGRGIRVCEEWLSFANFQRWAFANGYTDSLTLDRINVNGDYAPNNCRWADAITQHNNTRRNRYISFNGETKTIAEWAKSLDISYARLYRRIFAYGWDYAKALTIRESRYESCH